jgi:DNA-binding MarR family transcriptional regulator
MSHEATLWAVRAKDVPLDERMLLIYLADSHCPDNGCFVTLAALARDGGIDEGELLGILERLEARGKIQRIAHSDRWLLEFEFASFAEEARS